MEPEIIEIRDAAAKVRIAPALGAGIVSYDVKAETRILPVFRHCADLSNIQPFDLAMNLLVPWSNRISGGGFNYRGAFYPLDPNVLGEPYPIHGNAFLSSWVVEDRQPAMAKLSFFSEGPGPYRYLAKVTYVLDDSQLDVTLFVENLAPIALPYGMGLHPWFPRSAGATLKASASRVVLENGHHLPDGERNIGHDDEWNFRQGRTLPERWINNAFLDWDGRANIDWTDNELSLDILADAPLKTFVVYSPGADADYFCFEPVSHRIDAHNSGDSIEKSGLVELSPGGNMSAHCRFAPHVR